MKNFGSSILGLLLLSISPLSNAAIIGFTPSSQSVLLGDSFDVELIVSDLGDFEPDSLGAFDFNVSFDDSILSFIGATFGDPILGNQLDLLSLGFNPNGVSSILGEIDLFEISLDSSDDLDYFQPSSFTLATLSFDTLAEGTSFLSYNSIYLSDSIGNVLSAENDHASVIVSSPVSVPEPSIIVLFCAGLVGLGITRRRRSLLS